MQKKQVAVIDVGSSSIRAVVGERGINKTFIIKGSCSFDYDGYSDGEFFNVEQLRKVLVSVSEFIKKSANGNVKTVYVGVPGDFTEVVVKDSQISFLKKKKIQDEDVDKLFDSAFVMTSTKFTMINRSAIVYELDDFRRLANPVGVTSEILKGKLSFVLCSNYFIEAIKPIFVKSGIPNVEFVSSALAEALYLIDAETRDRTSMLLDVGHISTTFTIIQGDGILYQKSFSYGGGYITANITEKFGIGFDVAESLKRKINLSSISSKNPIDVIETESGDMYNVEDVKNAVIRSLDDLCEGVASAIEDSGYIIPDYVPLSVTGGGITYIRGAKEHVSNRLGMLVNIVAPKVPLMDKPIESTKLSLMDLALEQK